MVSSAPTQQTLCPVCHRADKAKTLQAVFDNGMQRFAPPPMPTSNVPMVKFLSFGMVIVGLCVFFIIVLIGSESFGQDFSPYELLLVSATLISIVIALFLSWVAFNRVQRGDQESAKQYPFWDQALANWESLRYCSRDNVVFDPTTNKIISDEQLKRLTSTNVQQIEGTAAILAH